jgi:very-short-patch-repair endonuclease
VAVAAVDITCEREARGHHGIISRKRAVSLGMSAAQVRYRVAAGRWIEIFPGVYFIGGTRPTWESRLAAAVAWAGLGAVAGGRAAAAFFGLDGCRRGPIEVIGRRPITRAPFRFHHTNYLPRHHIRIKESIPITKPARTVFDVAALVPRELLRKTATDALRKRLTTLGELRAVLQELQARGRNGTVAVRDFLEQYDPRLSRTANDFEASLYRILMKAGLPLPEPQRPIFDALGRIARLDFIYFTFRVVIETDGFGFHSDAQAFARDHERRNRLALDGWLVLVFTWEQVMFRSDEIVGQVSRAIETRG